MADEKNPTTPADLFPPGEFLQDALDNRGWTQSEFAEIIGRPIQLVNEIIAGKRAITAATANEISAALGTSPEYWLNLESMHQLAKAPPAAERIAQEAKLRSRFPVRELTKRRWLSPSKSFEDVQRGVFHFFRINSLDEPLALDHAARRNHVEEDVTVLQWAWIFRVRQIAEAHRIGPYSERKLRDAISGFEKTLGDPSEIRNVPKALAECGVRLVIVEPIPGSDIHGVCFWINEQSSPVVGLTLKWDYIDRVWFNIRHELEHVLRGDGKTAPVIDDFEEGTANSVEEAEIAANKAAAEFCVPQKQLQSFINRHNPAFSAQSFMGFSRIVGRHPGIVAGQLQHKIKRNDLFRKHQVRVRPLLLETALADGYGHEPPDLGEEG